jgi:hypothetical protein
MFVSSKKLFNTYGATTLTIMTFSIMTLSIMTLSIMTFSMTINIMLHSA